MAVSQANRIRQRARLISREVKWIFAWVPPVVRCWLIARLWRWLFKMSDGGLHRAGEIMLADLRDFARVGETIFDIEPLVMARRLGRREVVERIINYLQLDEATVQMLMEIDDGLGE